MNSQRYMGLIAGSATLLSTAPLWVIFAQRTWLFQCVIIVALITAAAALARSLRAPVWAQAVSMGAALLLALTWFFPGDGNHLPIPTPATFATFADLLQQSVEDMRSYGVPVVDRPALLFLTALGVGGVAIVVDLVTVSLRRPALAGLPMLAIYSVPVAIYTGSVPPLPFIIGACGFLWLLVADNVERVRRFGRRYTGDGRDIDVWEPSPLAAAGRRLAAVGVLLAVVVPLATPDLGTGLVDQFGSGSGDGKGKGSRRGPGAVDLFAELSGRLNQSATHDMVKVTTNEPDPYYLRFAVADVVTQSGFASRTPDGRPVRDGLTDPRGSGRTGASYRAYHATVEITDRFDMPLLPTYAQPINTKKIDSSWSYDPDAQVIYSRTSGSAGMKYEFSYVRTKYDPDALRSTRGLPSPESPLAELATVPVVDGVGQRVDQLIEGWDNDYDRVRAIYDSLSTENGFAYSLATETGTRGSDIADFLEKKTGFCEQYAAALAWMVRAAGIPARVAFGFTNGTAREGGSYTLTNRNLHAWTEVYFSGFGWIPFDATPTASVPGSVVSAWAPDTTRPTEAAPTDPTSTAGSATGTKGPTQGNEKTLDPDSLDAAGPLSTSNSTNWPWWVIGTILLAALISAPALRRQALRRRRRARPATVPVPADSAIGPDVAHPRTPVMTVLGDAGTARDDAHAAWDELLDTLVDFRIRVDPAETPRATADRLICQTALTGDAATATLLLGRAEERARYARTPLRGEGLTPALTTVRAALTRRANRRQRVTALVMPPSVLLRWRRSVTDLGANMVLALGRWRSRLSPRARFNARRRGPVPQSPR